MDNMEQLVTKTYLKNTSLKLLENWSVQYLLESKFSYNDNFELVPIGSFLIKSRLKTLIEDEKTYQRVTVKINNNGVFPRDTEIGKNIGTKQQYLVKSGQFLMSKIDARNGAFGLVPKNLEGAIVTNDFPVFDVDKSVINPEFLVLITTTKEFIKFAQSCSSGTTNRQRIDIDLFLNVKIPLPTLPEQNRIVETYNAKMALADGQEQKADELEKGIEKFLFKELGITIFPPKKSRKGMQLVAFSISSRWDTQFLIGNLPIFTSKFDLVNFSSLISCFNKGKEGNSIRINSTSYPIDDFRFIGMENIEKETGNLLQFQKVKGKVIKSQTLRVPKGFILFGKLRPYLNKYWKNDTDYENIICSSEFFVFDIELNLNKDFFIQLLSSTLVQNQISDKTSGARMPRINEDIFYNLKIPIPPLELQNSISESIEKIKIQVNDLKTKATKNRHLAIKEFENEIFKPCN